MIFAIVQFHGPYTVGVKCTTAANTYETIIHVCKVERLGGSSKGVDFGGTIVVDFGYHHLELWANHEEDESAMDKKRESARTSPPSNIKNGPYMFVAYSSDDITLFKSITMLYGTDNIPTDCENIQEYFVEYYLSQILMLVLQLLLERLMIRQNHIPITIVNHYP